MKHETFTRKDLASILQCSVITIRRMETERGLLPAKVKGMRWARYDAAKVRKILGFDDDTRAD